MATLKAMFRLFDGYSTTADKINRKTDQATDKILKASGSTDKFNTKLKATGASANTASSGLGKLVSAAALVAGAIKGMSIVDEYTNTNARLNLINDGLQTQAELQDKIFAAADRSKGAYSSMAGAISKMGITASEAFGSNDELIAFTELIQKGFKVGGASSTEQSSAMLQLTQAMGSGKLQGDEFRSIMENAPMIADAIAKYTGKSKGELKQMSADGVITSDIIKNAMFMASDDINAKFKTMPMTFADIWNKIKNGATQKFAPVIELVNKITNSKGFNDLITGIIIGINLIAGILYDVISIIKYLWPVIEPMLLAIGIILAVWVYQQIPLLITKLWLMVAPIMAQAEAWMLVNWPILLIAVAIGLLLYAIIKFGDTAAEVVGFVGGVFGGLFTFLYNAVAYLVNPWISFAEFFANVFNNPVYSIKKLFVNLASNVLNLVQSIAQAIDNVLGSNMADSLQKLKDSMNDWLGSKPEDYKEFTKMQMLDITSGVDFGYNIGKKAGQWAVDGVQGIAGKIGNLFNLSGNGTDSSGTSNNPVAVIGTGNNGKVDVNMADEDLQYMRDIAERDYINKFSTATLAPNIQFTFGDVKETADVNKVAKRLRKILQEEIAMASEGVYDV